MGVGKFAGELSKEANSNPNKVKRRVKKSSSSSDVVRKLFGICKDVFASAKTGVVPPKDEIERLRSVLDTMKPEDVGLSPEMQYFKAGKDWERSKITYLHLHECDKFSIGIFCLPPSAVIPLHNHPGMTVFSKLLFGTMHIRSYDWVDDVRCEKVSNGTLSKEQINKVELTEVTSKKLATAQVAKITAKEDNNVELAKMEAERPSEVRLAKIKADADFTAPCKTSILYPSEGGNIHCFTAKTACAVLDVLGPPYSDPDGRHCTYYLEHPFSKFSDEGISVAGEERKNHAWLEDRGDPEELSVVGALYRGPMIKEQWRDTTEAFCLLH